MRLAVLTAVVVLAGSPAIGLTPGGGPPRTDCLVEFGTTPANYPPSRPRQIRCVDNDPSCDTDATVGRCGIPLSVCLNVTDANLPDCAPASLELFTIKNFQPDTNPKHDFGFQTLQDQVNQLFLPLSPAQHDRCTADDVNPATISITMKLSLRTQTYHKTSKTLRSRLDGHAGTTAVNDSDTLKISCLPGVDGPCTGVTGTFDQMRRQIFTPRCALPTCHAAAQPPHDLSLQPGDAYTNLVNVVASESNRSLDRVLPGDVDNSFLVLKLRGTLELGEGERMPRGGPYLDASAMQLITDWVAGGAPETGFVGSASDCPH
ncbi:MAG: hypothetical protein E6J79_11275 [Deltaproteobacteria bacterium]|nr:MAG: hypothetical protein E6J79_11275 [Deltaproteobacteria bacterium]